MALAEHTIRRAQLHIQTRSVRGSWKAAVVMHFASEQAAQPGVIALL
jgi:hypothetical protein